MRNYSLSGVPGAYHYRISVKREIGRDGATPAGHVSNHFHDHVGEGHCIEVGPPCGDFTLKPATNASTPLVLVSAGVGITPLVSMLHAAAGRGDKRDIWFIHGTTNGDTHAFRDEVLQLAERHPNIHVHFQYSRPTRQDRLRELFDGEGVVDTPLLRSLVERPDATFYLCGPKPFMTAIHAGLLAWGVSPRNLHHEFFGPLQELRQDAEVVA